MSYSIDHHISPRDDYELAMIQFLERAFQLLCGILRLPDQISLRVCRYGGRYWATHAGRYNRDLNRIEINVRCIGYRNRWTYLSVLVTQCVEAAAVRRGYVSRSHTGRDVWVGPRSGLTVDMLQSMGTRVRFLRLRDAYARGICFHYAVRKTLDLLHTTRDQLSSDKPGAKDITWLPNRSATARNLRALRDLGYRVFDEGYGIMTRKWYDLIDSANKVVRVLSQGRVSTDLYSEFRV